MTTAATDRAALHSEIELFYARHMHLLDAGEADAWAATFAPDADFAAPTLPEPVRGRPALAAAVRHSAAELAAAGTIHRHWHGMLDVTPRPDGSIQVRCYALVIATQRGGEPRVHRSCVCEDTLTRTADGALQVHDRRVTRDDR